VACRRFCFRNGIPAAVVEVRSARLGEKRIFAMRKIGPVNLATVDLNLLVGFEALLAEGSVSGAGRRIGLAQSSMSNVLSRLRVLFDDDLFVRSAGGLRATRRAKALAGPIEEALRQVRAALDVKASFEPATAQRHFRIAVSDHADFTLAPAFAARLRREAPGIGLDIEAVDQPEAIRLLEEDRFDHVIAAFDEVPKRVRRASLYRERFVCVSRKEHAAFKGRPSAREFLALPHIRVQRSERGDLLDASLGKKRLKRNVQLTITNFAVLPYLLEGSDLVAVIGERIARRFGERFGLSVHELPFQVPPWLVEIFWNGHTENDAGSRWLRNTLIELGSAVDGACGAVSPPLRVQSA
jgi:DNA-binding transcriptional LysR family regulator